MNARSDAVMISTYGGVLRHIDIFNKNKPSISDEYKPHMGLAYCFHWHPNQQLVILCGNASYLELLEIETQNTSIRQGHTTQPILWVYWVDNGKRILSTNYHETILWDCPDPYQVQTWTSIFKLNEKEKFFPL